MNRGDRVRHTDVCFSPLQGVRVVRCSEIEPARLTCQLLEQHGAEIVPLRAGVDSDEAWELIRAAEIMVGDTSERGVVGTTGGPVPTQELWRLNPQLVISTFGRLVGPQEADVPADDPFANELTLAQLGMNALAGRPLRPEPLPVASTYAALLAAIYSVAALLNRDARGAGVHIDVPLAVAAATVLAREATRFDDAGLVDIADLPHLPNVQLYQCADGRYVQPHGLYPRFARVLCDIAGHPEWGDAAADGVVAFPDAGHVQLWRRRLAEVFARRPAAYWEEAVNAAGGACTVTRTHEEWIAEQHPYAAGVLHTTGRPTGAGLGPAVVVEPLGPGQPGGTVTPRHGADAGLPLNGVRVVDFCIVLAGPTCGRVLAELGADVIKVDDPERFVSPYGWFEVNRGKRSIMLDLRVAGAHRIAERLVSSADVVVQNFRDGKIASLGLDPSKAATIRPDIVYASLNAFDFEGPWRHRAGWEHNAQAATGMQWLRERDGVPQQVPYPVNDYATGLLGALGVVIALYHRRRTGVGAQVRSSLARAATLLQRPWLARTADAGDADVTTASAYVPCEAADGWVWVPRDAAEDLHEACGDPPSSLTCTQILQRCEAERIHAVAEAFPDADRQVRAWMLRHGVLTRWEHPDLGWFEQITARPLTSVPLDRLGWPAPDRGSDSDEILQDIGLTVQEIKELHRSGAVRRELPIFDDRIRALAVVS